MTRSRSRVLHVGAFLLGSAFLTLACGSGSSKPAAGSASASAPTSAVQTTPSVVSTFQAAAMTPVTNPVERVSGTVQSVDGNTVTLKEGGSFMLTTKTGIAHSLPAHLTDLVPGKIVAVAAKVQPDNSLLASSISVYRNAPTSTFFRQYPLDHGNLMTNATIDLGFGNAFTITFPGGTAKVQLASDAKIEIIAPATPTDLKAGASITALVLDGVATMVAIL